MTAIQLEGSFANGNLHFHTLISEGVGREQPDGSIAFHRLPPPADEDVEALATGSFAARRACSRTTTTAARAMTNPTRSLTHRRNRCSCR